MSSGESTDALSQSQRRAVLRIGAVAVALTLAVPGHFVLAAVLPQFGRLVPPRAALAVTALGLCVAFPVTLAYRHHLRGESDRVAADGAGERYGVGDRWERQNL